MNICLCGILMFKFNILFYNVKLDFKENLKNIYLEKTWENGAKKQELFNCLLFPVFHILFTFSKRMFFTFFPSAFSKRIFSHVFTLFHKNVKNEKTCEKMRFENALGKNVKEMRFENALGKKT